MRMSSYLKRATIAVMVIGIIAMSATAAFAQAAFSPYNVSTANSDVFQSHRPTVRGTNYAVASGNQLATEAGMIVF